MKLYLEIRQGQEPSVPERGIIILNQIEYGAIAMVLSDKFCTALS